MVRHHESPMLQFYRATVSTLAYSQNQLSLSSVHHRIKPSRIHSEWIKILFLPNVSIASCESLNCCVKQITYTNRPKSYRFPRSFLLSPFLIILLLVLLFLLIIIIMAINVWLFFANFFLLYRIFINQFKFTLFKFIVFTHLTSKEPTFLRNLFTSKHSFWDTNDRRKLITTQCLDFWFFQSSIQKFEEKSIHNC